MRLIAVLVVVYLILAVAGCLDRERAARQLGRAPSRHQPLLPREVTDAAGDDVGGGRRVGR
ncbi:MAG: hypothetical protein JWO31_3544, partial [Phycisphaerales bacterium]|nr:hypothetical protein [Phycisphaerales bacterium]